jgi:hypothetical protein
VRIWGTVVVFNQSSTDIVRQTGLTVKIQVRWFKTPENGNLHRAAERVLVKINQKRSGLWAEIPPWGGKTTFFQKIFYSFSYVKLRESGIRRKVSCGENQELFSNQTRIFALLKGMYFLKRRLFKEITPFYGAT